MSEENKPEVPKVFDDKKKVAVQLTEAQGMMIAHFLGRVRTAIHEPNYKTVAGAYESIIGVFGEPPKLVRRARPDRPV